MVGNVTSGWMPGEDGQTDTANTATTSVIMVQTGVLVKSSYTGQYKHRKTILTYSCSYYYYILKTHILLFIYTTLLHFMYGCSPTKRSFLIFESCTLLSRERERRENKTTTQLSLPAGGYQSYIRCSSVLIGHRVLKLEFKKGSK